MKTTKAEDQYLVILSKSEFDVLRKGLQCLEEDYRKLREEYKKGSRQYTTECCLLEFIDKRIGVCNHIYNNLDVRYLYKVSE